MQKKDRAKLLRKMEKKELDDQLVMIGFKA